MNPFDQPPTSPPVSVEPQPPSEPEPRRRGRMALVALTAAGLVGVSAVGISQLAGADRPSTAESLPTVADTAATTVPDTAPSDTTDDTSPDTTAPADESDDTHGDITGEIVIDSGDGDPIVIDLGDPALDEGKLDALHECLGGPLGPFDFDFDFGEPGAIGDLDSIFERFGIEPGELPDFGAFTSPDGTHVTVFGPDGASVVDFGEGDGSVTITRSDGDVTIETDGDATVSDLSDVFGGALFDDGALQDFLDDLPFDPEALPDHLDAEPVDTAAVQACIDEALGR